MCGIAGIVEPPGAAPSSGVLWAMGSALQHRGPDDGRIGLYGRAGLSFRRLSIIDVAGGAQPISDEERQVHVILNGEIYNHRELRVQLEARGHRFRTRSDVEAVVHGYEEWSEDVVPRLRGMFAFALWDERRQRLLLARDRFGEKPLVYWTEQGRLVFASELAALLAEPGVPREPDPAAIHHYLTLQYVPAPLTAYRDVHKLPPAHLAVFEQGALRLQRYWTLSSLPAARVSEEEAAGEVRRLLREAVRVRLMSEVPLGAFLSGGIDSSSVVALMAEEGPVKTFSIGFDEADFDELAYAREVARRFGTEHHEFVVRPAAADVLPELVDHYGEPFADSSALPTYYLAQLTRRHVTVALTGDGADELFAGYERYKLLPAPEGGLRQTALRTAAALLSRLGPMVPARLRRLASIVAGPGLLGYARMMSYFAPEEKDALYTEDARERLAGVDTYGLLYEACHAADAPDLIGRILAVEASTYLPDDLLAKVDIATMAHGLEARAPFLDHPLAEFAARLPSSFKLSGGIGKRVLRAAMRDALPPAVVSRRKMGFGVPIGSWFRGELAELLRQTLLSARARQRGLFRPEGVAALLEEHLSGRGEHGARLWALLMLELWWQRQVDVARPTIVADAADAQFSSAR